MDRFEWIPDRDADVDYDLQLKEVQFGDGVVQVQQTMLAKPKRKFSLTFYRGVADVQAIEAFLVARRGRRFLLPWGGTDVKVRCTEIKRKVTGFADTLTCTFKEEHI